MRHEVLNVIASENTGTTRDTVYPRGKGVCKHKTTDCCLRQSVGQKRSIRRISRKGRLVNPTQDTFVLAWRKRRTQAKDKQLSLATIVWSKVQCAPRGKAIPPQLRWYCLLMCFRIKELWIVINVIFGARGDFRPVCRSTARRLPL